MPRTRKPYPDEFKRKLIDLVRQGRTPEELARQFEPSAQSIRNWVTQDDRDKGRRTDGLTTDERDGAGIEPSNGGSKGRCLTTSLAEELLLFHIFARPRFASLHAAGEYFDISRDPVAISARIDVLERALKFHTKKRRKSGHPERVRHR